MPPKGTKRKQPPAAKDAPEEGARRPRRQAHTSCLNCRTTKRKCDQGVPCHSCASRNIECINHPNAELAEAPNSTVETLLKEIGTRLERVEGRLDRLERELYNEEDASPPPVQNQRQPSVAPTTATMTSFVTPLVPFRRGNENKPDKEPVECNYVRRITPHPSREERERQQTAKVLDSAYTQGHHDRAIQLTAPTYHISEIAANPWQFTERPSHLTTDPVFIMNREQALQLLQDFFDNPYHLLPILHVEDFRSTVHSFYTDLEQGTPANPSVAALLLSIAATSASFCNQGTKAGDLFESSDLAMEATMAWMQASEYILDYCMRARVADMQTCQARTILAYVLSNIEGCSARFRHLHSCSVAAARDLGLHLMDTPSKQANRIEDPVQTELKRRLWWHLAATDWLLGLVGGPLDGTYTIQPHHFVVNRPRNLKESYETTMNVVARCIPTGVSCFLERISLAEICRDIIDARDPIEIDSDIRDFETVASLDKLFENSMARFPPFLQEGGRAGRDAPPTIYEQRDLIVLCYHIRRAKLHRPFLLYETANYKYEPSRRQCVKSAYAALELATEMLQGTRGHYLVEAGKKPLATRVGLIISSTFMACAILALNAKLVGSQAHVNEDTSAFLSECHTRISSACDALSEAGKESPFAANLLQSLVRVLNEHKMNQADSQQNENDADEDAAGNAGGANDLLSLDLNGDDNSSIWNELFVTMPVGETFDELFAELDFSCGTLME